MSKHTPGPWEVTGQSDAGRYITVWSEVTGRSICRVAFSPINDPDPSDDSNARLIAAAPQLLAALRECEHELSGREDIDGNGNPNSAMRLVPLIEAAIAKATGEPPSAESIDIERHL